MVTGVTSKRSNLALWALDNLIWVMVAVAFVLFSLLLPGTFTSYQNIEFMLYASAALGALVLAESIALLSGNFDLSIGSIAGFSAMFTALFITQWFPGMGGFVGILVILVIGGIIGLVNGFAIGYLGINPFLQTLGIYIMFRGAVVILSPGTVAGLPDSYLFVGGGTMSAIPVIGSIGFLSGIPFAIILILGLFSLTWYGMNYTRIGLSILAVGGSENSAKAAGIPKERVVLLVFVISGMLSGLAGLLYTGYLTAATPTLARGELFPAFAAAVIAGISLDGGRGSIANAFGGLILLTMIKVGLVQLRVGAEEIQFVNGLVLLVAIYFYLFDTRLRERITSK
ncbi:ABC transporter permease [Halobacteriales archaeon QS_4_62_28]|nr:MAG: ABC transporter permease [Halobacteriales archaeon QS_4_62_28]